MVEVDRGRVLGQQGEPDVVGGGHGPAQGVTVDVAHLEIFIKAPLPPGNKETQTVICNKCDCAFVGTDDDDLCVSCRLFGGWVGC